MPSLRRILGSAGAAVLTILALADAPDQLGKLKTYVDSVSVAIGVDWSSFFSGNGGRTLLVIVGLALGLWAWDVPKLLRTRSDPGVIEEGKRRRVREEIRSYFRSLYDQTARHAIGKAFEESDNAVRGLRQQKDSLFLALAANLLIEHRMQVDDAIRPMLDSREYTTEEGLCAYMQAWGRLFVRYQSLVRYTHDAYKALETPLGSRVIYWEWRVQDERFIAALKDAEHMPGAGHIVSGLRQAGWGDESSSPWLKAHF